MPVWHYQQKQEHLPRDIREKKADNLYKNDNGEQEPGAGFQYFAADFKFCPHCGSVHEITHKLDVLF